MIQQGHVVIIPFPYSDLRPGKLRPALVISNENFNKSQDIIVLGISKTNHSQFGIPINAQSFEEGALKENCHIHCHKILRIEQSHIWAISGKFKKEVVQNAGMMLHSLFQTK